MEAQLDPGRERLHKLLEDMLRDLLLLMLYFGFLLFCRLLAALLCLLATAAVVYKAALVLLRGRWGVTEGLLGLSLLLGLLLLLRRSAPEQRGWVAELVLSVGSWLLLEPGEVCLAGARSLLTLLAPLWDSLAGSVLRVGELLATFLALVASRAAAVASRATATSIWLWLRCRLTFKLLCSATVVFISVYFLAAVCHSGAQSLGTPSGTLRDSLTSPLFGVTDLLAALLAPVSSGAMAVSLLPWRLCQMAFELLCSITKVFISICLLVSSLARSLLGLCLMGSQYLSMLLAILWDLLSSLILGVTNVLGMVLAFLLWVPLQLALTLLSLVTQLLSSIFFFGVHILGLLLRVAFLTVFVVVIYCNQEVLGVLKGRVLGYSRSLQPALWHLYQVALVTWHRAISSQPWRRLVGWVLTTWRQGSRRMNQRRQQLEAGQGPQPGPALSRAGAGQHHQTAREEPGTSCWKAPRKQQLNSTAEGTPNNDPWALLKEQEEDKKCVICHDKTKKVLLLPCRHLCLCQECTEVLLQQDIYQRNCPLCRQRILQTLNVYL